MNKSFVKRNFLGFLIPVFVLTGFFVGNFSAEAEWANHIVISAVQITGGTGKTSHDFIEIYNPTTTDINLKGYRLVKRTKTGVTDAPIKSWTDDIIIGAHAWRLWVSSEDSAYPSALGADDFTTQTIAADNGIAIRFGALDTGEIIDSLAWGAAENIFKEGQPTANPAASEKLIRKPATTGAGNGEDTNNNLTDFIIGSGFTPHNSLSVFAPAFDTSQPSDSPSEPSSPAVPSFPPAGSVPSSIPTAEAGPDKSAVIGEPVDFDGSDSYDPSGKEISYNWTFGDGAKAKGVSVSHTYDFAGWYTVTLKVDNKTGTAEDSASVKISEPEFSDKVIISEIMPDPVRLDKDGEWIELENLSDKKVNLRGWILETKTKSSSKKYLFPGDNFIEPKGYLLIKRNQSNLVLVNSGAEVNLLWPGNKILSTVSYGEAKKGKSYALFKGSWYWTDVPTPGKANIIKSIDNTAKDSAAEEKNITVVAAATDNGDQDSSILIGEKSQLQKNAVQLIAVSDLEKYLEKIIGDKISDAISGASIKTAEPSEKISAKEISGPIISARRDETGSENKALCSAQSKQKDIKNNTWFYGDLVLSALSLFLLWQYWKLKKRVK